MLFKIRSYNSGADNDPVFWDHQKLF